MRLFPQNVISDQMPPKSRVSDLSKHIVIIMQNSFVAVSDTLFLHCFLDTCLCLFVTFEILSAKGSPKMMLRVLLLTGVKIGPRPQKAPKGFQSPAPEIQRVPRCHKMSPTAIPKWRFRVFQSHRNGVRIMLFQVTYKQRKNYTKILAYTK